VCLSKPNIPDPVVPPPVQASKTPELNSFSRDRKRVTNGSTLLTSSTGVGTGSTNTGSTTLLGG